MLDDRRPIGNASCHRLIGTNHVRQQELGRAPAVIADLVDASATEEKKAAHQSSGMVKTACRRPAIGSPENSRVAKVATDTGELAGDKIERFIPRHFMETVGAGTGPAFEPPITDRRPADTQWGMHHVGDGGKHWRRRWVVSKGFAANYASALDQ